MDGGIPIKQEIKNADNKTAAFETDELEIKDEPVDYDENVIYTLEDHMDIAIRNGHLGLAVDADFLHEDTRIKQELELVNDKSTAEGFVNDESTAEGFVAFPTQSPNKSTQHSKEQNERQLQKGMLTRNWFEGAAKSAKVSCSKCKFSARKSDWLETHQIVHGNTVPYQCPDCTYKTFKPTSFNKHILTHDEDKAYSCPHCSHCFSSSVYLQGHIKSYHADPISECTGTRDLLSANHSTVYRSRDPISECDQQEFPVYLPSSNDIDRDGAYKSVNSVDDTPTFSNRKCYYYKRSNTTAISTTQTAICTRQTGRQTAICSSILGLSVNIDTAPEQTDVSVAQVDNVSSPATAHINKPATTKLHYNNTQQQTKAPQLHRATRNDPTSSKVVKYWKLICYTANCDFIATKSDSLELHKVVHTTAAPYHCTKCAYQSYHTFCFNLHVLRHNNDMPYGCKQCSKRYVAMSALYQHKKSYHSKAKEYQCEQCSKYYTTSYNLKKHVKFSHYKMLHDTSIPPDSIIKCARCDFTAFFYKKLCKHMKEAHSERITSSSVQYMKI